jgi:hypothetical protein
MKVVNKVSKKFGMPYHAVVRELEGFNAAYNRDLFKSDRAYYAERDKVMARAKEKYDKAFGDSLLMPC